MARRKSRQPQPNPPIAKAASSQSVTQITKTQVFEGPIPPPTILRDYEVVIPGAAERLIKAFEDESAHRRAMEKFQLEADVAARNTQLQIQEKHVNSVTWSDSIGQFLGAIVSISFMIGAIVSATLGHLELAIVLGAVPTASVIRAFFVKRDNK